MFLRQTARAEACLSSPLQSFSATATPTATPTPASTPGDDFNRADSTNLGPNWTERSGDWQIVAQTLRNASTGGDLVASYNSGPYSNVAVSAQVQITSGAGTTSIGARWGSYVSGVPGAGYNAELLSTGQVILWRVSDWGQLGTYTIPGYTAGSWYTLTLRANGPNLSVDVNGVTRLTATDGAFTSGEVGVWSFQPTSAGQHRFDNFVIEPLGGGGTGNARRAAAPATPATRQRVSFTAQRVSRPVSEGPVALAASAPMNGTVSSLVVNLSVADPTPQDDVLARPFSAPSFSTLLPDGTISTTITYEYDNLYRLTKTTYSSGAYFDYTYDATGNRLSQVSAFGTITSTYDIANRLINTGGTTYQWDNNGNLLSDGTSIYAYDAANRLTSVTQGPNNYAFTYNGLGDRVQQTVNSVTTNYALDLNAGLTQVLADGTNTYLYGNSRIAQYAGTTPAYFLGDALGSVRQLTNASGAVTLAKSYEPFGSVMSSSGSGVSRYGFTGEQQEGGLVYLRARFYASGVGRFTSRDVWPGDYAAPITLNKFVYANANPVLYRDPSGQWSIVGFTWGPGAPCTSQEQADWARKWSAAQRYYTTAWSNIQGGVEFSTGFLQEYIDGISIIPVVTLLDAGLCYLVGAGRQCILYIFPTVHGLLNFGLNRQCILYIIDGSRRPICRYFRPKPRKLLAVDRWLDVTHALAAQRTMPV